MKNRFLPIGTVVKLAGGTTPVMIIGYASAPTENAVQMVEGKKVKPAKKMYEYFGCPYPIGVLDPSVMNAFDHVQIAEILHLGYETDVFKEYNDILNKGYDQVKKEFEEAK